MATDIAFAIGVLALLANRVPKSLITFLVALAIVDDLGAVVVIALFYTDQIVFEALLGASIVLAALIALSMGGIRQPVPYFILGLVLWAFLLKSGVHATLAGVILAMFIPMKSKADPSFSPLKSMEHDLHSVVAFFILPVFAFANAGINFSGVGLEQLQHGVPMGIAFGLFFGKQIGIFGLCWIVIKLGLTKLPNGMSFSSLYGTAALCGIGFTMSLFIGSLAFEETGVDLLFDERLGIVLGSLLSGLLGFFILKFSLKKT